MQLGTSCAICERDISSPSPDGENKIKAMKAEGLTPSSTESSVTLSDNNIAHAACKEILDFLNSLGTSHEVVERRLKTYRAGKPFGAYMNWPYGLETLSVSSYRVLTAAFSAVHDIQMHWLTGNILPGECFRRDVSRSILLVQDLTLEESSGAQHYASIAQTTLSYAVTLWVDAHKSKVKYKDDQEMFLEWDMYEDTLKPEVDHFKEKRNKAIGHIATHNWDDQNINHPYQAYPDWANDWKRFRELLGHSIDLCLQDIDEKLGVQGSDLNGFPRGVGGGYDPIKPGVDLMNTLGIPRTTGVGERPPMQGPYSFVYDGTKWVEIKRT